MTREVINGLCDIGCVQKTMWVIGTLFWLLSLPQTGLGEHDIDSLPHEARLVAHVLERAAHFGTHARPMSDSGVIMNVPFGLRVVKIDVDEKRSLLAISAWCRIRWFDENLKWNASDYGGLEYVYIPSTKIWTPDITLVNSVQSVETLSDNSRLSLRYDGRVFWSPHRLFQVPCLFTLLHYPNDEYACDLWFQSLGYSSKMVRPQIYKISNGSAPFDLDTYLGGFRLTDEWQITANTSREVARPIDEGVRLMWSKRYSLCMTLRLRRRSGFMPLLLTVPCIVFSVMCCVVFCIPPSRPDRHAFANSLFSSFMLFMLILAGSLPPTSGALPRLGIFYGFNSMLIVLAIFLSVLNININRRGTTGARMPPFIEKLFLRTIGPLVLVQPIPHDPEPAESKELIRSPWYVRDRSPPPGSRRQDSQPPASGANGTRQLHRPQVLTKLDEVVKRVRALEGQFSRPRATALERQWEDLAIILDRCFVLVYIVIIAVGLALLFPWPTSGPS